MCFHFEALEPRRLLSSTMVAQFVSGIPKSAMPQAPMHVALRISDPSSPKTPQTVRVSLFASPQQQMMDRAIALNTPAQTVRVVGRHGGLARFRFSSTSSIASGPYFLIARVDPVVTKVDEASTVVVAPHATNFVSPVVDLTAQIIAQPSEAIYVSSTQAGTGKLCVLVFNAGNVPAVGTVSISAFASTDATFKATAPVVGQKSAPKFVLGAGKSRAFEVPLVLPAGTAAGSYKLFVQINASGGISENNLANDVASSLTPLVVTNTPPAREGNSGHRHHHGGIDGYGIGIGEVAVDTGVEVVDEGSTEDYPPSDTTPLDSGGDGAPDVGPVTGGTTDSSSGGNTSSSTTEPTTRPTDSGSDSESGDVSSPPPAGSGSDFGGSSDTGGCAGGDFGGTGPDQAMLRRPRPKVIRFRGS